MKSENQFTSKTEYQQYLRTYFAGLAMQGLLSNSLYTNKLSSLSDGIDGFDQNIMLTKEALDIADELLKALEAKL